VYSITGRNVNQVYNEALWRARLDDFVEVVTSRNGPVKRFKFPILSVYQNPRERVLWSASRDANPFFHLFEAMWMLAGRNDVHFPAKFAKQIKEYSDNGETLHGAYGHRWRKHFKFDQLNWVIDLIQNHPDTRRAVLTMWDASLDPYMVDEGGRDVPCNTHVYFSVQNGRVNMTVCNRSNDLVWGAYGANVVHMSYLHEYVALGAGYEVGEYRQFSNDLHIYEEHWKLLDSPRVMEEDPYQSSNLMKHLSLFDHPAQRFVFDRDISKWIEQPGDKVSSQSRFVNYCLVPMYRAWVAYKKGAHEFALDELSGMDDLPWSHAAILWIKRRMK
jgi:thymidylate synthase